MKKFLFVIIFLTMIQTALAVGPALKYPFDDGTGQKAVDVSGNDNNGTLGSSTGSDSSDPIWVFGKINNALYFDGVNDYVHRTDANLIGPIPSKNSGGAQDFSVSAWVKFDETGSREPIVSKQGNSQRGFVFQKSTGDLLNVEIFKNSADGSFLSSNITLTNGTWYHVVLTYNYVTDGTSEIRLYINGALVGSTNTAVGPPVGNAMSLEVGRYYWSSGYNRYFKGIIDEVIIEDIVWSPSQVLTQFNSQSACGDSTVHVGEQCDDGNNDNNDGCDSTCKIESECLDCETVPLFDCGKAESMTDSELMALGFDQVVRLTSGSPNHNNIGVSRDIVFGTSGSNQISTDGGDDFICSRQGVDTINSGSGNDVIFGGNGNDVINGSTGADFIDSGAGADTIHGFNGDDCITGSTGNDNIYAGSGHDFVTGASGSDTIFGETGNDFLFGGTKVDTINGGSGADKIGGGNDNDILSGGSSTDQIDGGSGNDTINGDGANDDLQGGQGADSITGGAGKGDTSDNDPNDIFVDVENKGGAPFLNFTLSLDYCFQVFCGDNVVRGDEECDDGNNIDGDGCSASCVTEFCGDNITQSGLGEECDDGNNIDGDGCNANCFNEYCGDNIVQYGLDEECDDGNNETDDGCENCEVKCINATYEYDVDLHVAGLNCHPLGAQDSELISVPFASKYEVFGKAFRGNPTQCQPNEDYNLEINGHTGPNTNDDVNPCEISVRLDALGIFNFTNGSNNVTMNSVSICPPDNMPNSVQVKKLCLHYIPECGNAIIDSGEQCDDGNNENNDGCDSNCLFEYPSEAEECFFNQGTIALFIGEDNDSVLLEGFTKIKRENASQGPDNKTFIQTEIIQMELKGISPELGSLKIELDNTSSSPGLLKQINFSLMFPMNLSQNISATTNLQDLDFDSEAVQLRLLGTVHGIPFPFSTTLNSLNTPDLLHPNGSIAGNIDNFTLRLIELIDCPICGNTEVEIGEECDDGNNEDGDGCNANCDLEYCGDGIVNNIDEVCDDGNNIDGDGCQSDCTLCEDQDNDGVCDEDDQCPDSNINYPVNSVGCDPIQFCKQFSCGGVCENAQFIPRMQYVFLEDRIPLSFITSYGCKTVIPHENGKVGHPVCAAYVIECVIDPECGNRVLEPGEECDDGNNESGDGCSENCTNEECVPVTEICFDGQDNDCDANIDCDDDDCFGDVACQVCGDGILTPPEQCELDIDCSFEEVCIACECMQGV